jgi:hypothetical protein
MTCIPQLSAILDNTTGCLPLIARPAAPGVGGRVRDVWRSERASLYSTRSRRCRTARGKLAARFFPTAYLTERPGLLRRIGYKSGG